MSDEGEKTCPLCAEEMDLTDQQLKPCRCGYEICVWCWHHIMDMAEKDDIEGRCPACRSPYDKEKIVGMAASCERLVSEINSGKKMKSQKSKTKPSEGRKQLSSVRVIQRNLVYIVGLPLDLADEDLLQNREYFGQYGKVMKVSMSRTASGVIQQFPNSTCSVYITYSKEEEAVRCIQSVHGFLLDGRSLRACFGTTKYCHAWLRNMPCSNLDCMYLHEIGSQEDSFTKDEIISAYTRNRVQQIMGPTNNLQRRSGNILPPPADDFCNSIPASAGKPIVKNPSNNTPSTVGDSPPNGSSCRSIALPAAASWGMHSSNCQTTASSLASLNGPTKNKSDTVNGTSAFSSAVASTTQASPLPNDVGKKSLVNEESHALHATVKSDSVKSFKTHIGFDSHNSESEIHVAPNTAPALKSPSSQLPSAPALNDNDRGVHMRQSMTFSINSGGQPCASAQENEVKLISDGKIQNLCSDLSSINIDRNVRNEHSGVVRPNNSDPDNVLLKNPGKQGLQQYNEQFRESLNSPAAPQRASLVNGLCDWSADSKTIMADTFSEVEVDILSFDNQRLKDPEVVSHLSYMPNSASSVLVSNHSRSHSLQHNEAFAAVNLNPDSLFVDNKVSDDSVLHQHGVSILSNGYPENLVTRSTGLDRAAEGSFMVPNQGKGKHMERSHSNAATDAGESSIISDILSMDFDAWDDPLTSPQNLAKLWGETDKQPGSVRTGSRKIQNSNQSRFSFARQEDSRNKGLDVELPFNVTGQFPKNRSFDHGFSYNRDSYLDRFGSGNGFSANNLEELDNFSAGHSSISSNRQSVSRAQISTPPGFSIPSRAPPPGFSSHERMDQSFDTISGNHLLDTSSLLRNTFQAPQNGSIGSSNDIEFMDPAILAVGKGRFQGTLNSPGLDIRQNFPPQLSSVETDARLQLLMQRSLSHQNVRFPDVGERFSLGDSYGTPSRLMDQSQVNGLPSFGQLSIQQSRNGQMSNGHWDGWNEFHGGNNLGMAELLRNERLGYNKYYNGYEDSKFRMTSSGDLYNRTFGM